MASTLAPDAEGVIADHLRYCQSCQAQLDRLADDDELRKCFDSYRRQEPVPAKLMANTFDALLNAPTRGPTDTQNENEHHARSHLHGGQLGRFELNRELGRGGFGVVYLAHDRLLKRDVALKFPLAPIFADENIRKSFLREGQIAGQLQHPNIVPVFEAGQVDNVCFLASAYCCGPTLSDWLDQQQAPVEAETAARIILQLSEAIEHAHTQGVLHRDIKPSNVLLDFQTVGSDGLKFVPRLTDFGLAKVIDGDTTGASVGLMAGTPRYMAPEQASGQAAMVGPGTDVYALGVLLYQLLTLQPPIEGENNAETLTKVLSVEPTRPRNLVSSIPRDLEAICLKCLEKTPKQRYASARQLADDLHRFLQGHATDARPLTHVGRFAKWSLRHPSWSALLVCMFLLVAALAALGWWSATMLRSTLAVTEDLLYVADVRLAAEAVVNTNSQRAEELLRRHIPQRGEPDRRGFVWYFLWSQLHRERKILQTTDHVSIWCFDHSRDGQIIAGGDGKGTIWLWDVSSGALIAELKEPSAAIRSLDFSPDEKFLISAATDDWVRVWDLATYESVHAFQPHDGTVYQVRYLESGDKVATCGADQVVRLWSSDTWQLAGELRGHTDRIYDVAISTDNQYLVSVGMDRVARFWDLTTGKLERDFVDALPGNRRYECVDLSPDRRFVAAGTQAGEILVWDVSSSKLVHTFSRHTSNVLGVSFSPNGDYLASASKDSTIRIWNLEQGTSTNVLQGHGRTVYDVRYSADGRSLASCGKDGAIRLWAATKDSYEQRELTDVRATRGEAGPLHIALENWGQRSYLLNSRDLQIVHLPLLNADWGVECSFSANGRTLVEANGPFFDPAGRLITSTADAHPVRADVDGDGDEDLVAAIGRQRLMVWQEATDDGQLLPPRLFNTESSPREVPEFQFVERENGAIQSWIRWDADELFLCPDPIDSAKFAHRRLAQSLNHPQCVWPVDLDADGDLDLVVATRGDHTLAWLENEGEFTFSRQHVISRRARNTRCLICADLEKNGRTVIAALDEAGQLCIYRRDESEQADTWSRSLLDDGLTTPAVLEVADVDQDGDLDLLVASRHSINWYRNVDGRLKVPAGIVEDLTTATWLRPRPFNVMVWDVNSQQPTRGFHALTDEVRDVACSPDGKMLATADQLDRIRLWDATSGCCMRTFPVIEEVGVVSSLVFSRDGRRLLFAAGDNGYVWDLATGATKPRKLSGHNNTVETVATSPHPDLVATTSHDYAVRIWDLQSHRTLQTLVGHKQRPVRVGFSADGKLLATGGAEGEILVWDVATGQDLLHLTDLRCQRFAALKFVDERTLMAVGEEYIDHDDCRVRIGIWRAGRDE